MVISLSNVTETAVACSSVVNDDDDDELEFNDASTLLGH